MSEEKIKYKTSTIAEMTNGIILANFEKESKIRETSYQSEAELERQLIENLFSQGYDKVNIKSNFISLCGISDLFSFYSFLLRF